MYEAFVRMLNMSFAAEIMTAVIALLRLLLKKAPRKYICLLWALVALRLVCPVSIGSSLSAFNLLAQDAETNGQIEYFEYNGKTEKPMVEFTVPPIEAEEETAQLTHTKDIYLPPVIKLWLAGAALMLLYALISYLRLRRQVAASIPLQDGVMTCDEIEAPFLLGLFRPTVYVPSGVEESTLQYILLHEKIHIRRGDHWWKTLGWVLLSIYWFNPLLWLAYVLFCRDIEIACDERVTRDMSRDGRAAYSEALLQCSLHRRSLMVCPLAFGEVGTKERVKNVLNRRKPGIFIIIAAILVVAVVAVCFLTGPKAVEGQALVMEDVYRLAQLGDDLTWEDFEPYAWELAQSERYARKYEINEQFEVIVESYGPESQPDSVHLRNKDINAWIDIRTGDILAFTSRPTFGGSDGPDSVAVTEPIDYPALFARYDAGGADGEAAEAILREHRDEALKYCMRQFDAGILEGLTLESTGAEMGMYHFWHSELGDALLESPFVGVAEDWQEWSEYVRYLYERNGYDEALFNETVPASKCYVEILMEESSQSESPSDDIS
ncbi:MAG: M56 family metallopeptidase [Ruminococcaceae bacterium]|nr:M56 family metallopeptidase [Oscillospiraceae bacterium]